MTVEGDAYEAGTRVGQEIGSWIEAELIMRHISHTAWPSRASNRFGFGGRDEGDQLSIRRYLSSVYEPPRFEVEQGTREQESIPPRMAKGGEYLGEKAQTSMRRRATIAIHIFLALLFTRQVGPSNDLGHSF